MKKTIAILAAGFIALSASIAMAATMSALTSSESQLAKAAETPYPITMVSEPSESYKVEGSKVIILRAGDYYLNMAAQVGGTTTGEIYLWMRVNGKDVADSNSIQTIPVKGFTAVLVSQSGMSLKKGDVVEFVYAASVPGLGLIAETPKGMPAEPSVIFSVLEM